MKRINSLKNSVFGRSFFVAKSAIKLLPGYIKGEEDPSKLLASLLGESVDKFVSEVGELKGSLQKAAQILSLYGEYYLPPEINEVLATVNSKSHYLEWDKISPLIEKHQKDALEIETTPIAAASIGQVHRAKIKTTGENVVLKVQYPGIKKAIDLDINILKLFLNMSRLLPKKVNMDGIYEEIKKVMVEEMDYESEIIKHQEYKDLLKDEAGFYIPKIYKSLSSEKVIVSEFIDGTSLAQADLKLISQEKKNDIGRKMLYLFFKEIFDGELIQTDSHGGNYLLRGSDIVLIDFGACLRFLKEDLERYRGLIQSVFEKNRAKFLIMLYEIVPDLRIDEGVLWDYCLLASSPLHSTDYDWGTTTLPEDLTPLVLELMKKSKIDYLPHKFIFLDRKLLGLFSILRLLKSRFDVKQVVESFMIGEKEAES